MFKSFSNLFCSKSVLSAMDVNPYHDVTISLMSVGITFLLSSLVSSVASMTVRGRKASPVALVCPVSIIDVGIVSDVIAPWVSGQCSAS